VAGGTRVNAVKALSLPKVNRELSLLCWKCSTRICKLDIEFAIVIKTMEKAEDLCIQIFYQLFPDITDNDCYVRKTFEDVLQKTRIKNISS